MRAKKSTLGNREAWLTEVARALEPLFLRKGYKFKTPYRITCGWPCKNATSTRQRRVGECHPIQRSKSGVSEIFISPAIDDVVEVAGTVCHELIHASIGTQEGHGGKFKTACRYLGMKGRPTQAMPGGGCQRRFKRRSRGLETTRIKHCQSPRKRLPSPNRLLNWSVSVAASSKSLSSI